ncbi:MAG TPA: Gfo/Idh/MocA family oxidoreductase [Bryobacteraceae bacterium]|nr:Gfo/Idh/MocA family oxidoreductase [Bryobacteraceae bacterium]
MTSRRTFLAAAAAAGRAVGANDRIRVGLVGCGGISRTDIATFLVNPEVECAAICDVDDARIARMFDHLGKLRPTKPDAVKDFRRIIERKDIDAVVVCTPDHWHALPTIQACQAGKDVYVEKPLATSIGEGRAMLDAARRYKRVVQMGTQWRSGPHYRDVVEYVQSGKLGKIRMVRAWAYLDWVGGIGKPPDSDVPAGVDYDMWLGPARLRPFNPNRFHFNFRWYWDYAGGLMTDWGVHLLNVALWAMGPEPPRTVTSTGGKFAVDDNTETPDTQIAVYEFPNYALVWEHQILGGIGPGTRPHGLSFCGLEGTLIVDTDGWEVIPEPKRKSLDPVKRLVAKGDRAADGRIAHVRNFLDCCGTRQDPVTNVDVGHFVSTVAHLGNIALRTRGKIAWDPAREHISGAPEAQGLIAREYRKPWTI